LDLCIESMAEGERRATARIGRELTQERPIEATGHSDADTYSRESSRTLPRRASGMDGRAAEVSPHGGAGAIRMKNGVIITARLAVEHVWYKSGAVAA
jgi:hypothetical protein